MLFCAHHNSNTACMLITQSGSCPKHKRGHLIRRWQHKPISVHASHHSSILSSGIVFSHPPLTPRHHEGLSIHRVAGRQAAFAGCVPRGRRQWTSISVKMPMTAPPSRGATGLMVATIQNGSSRRATTQIMCQYGALSVHRAPG